MTSPAALRSVTRIPEEALKSEPEALEIPQVPPAKPHRKFPVRRAVMGVVLAAALSGAAWYGHDWYTVGRFTVSTDDAYVKTDTSALGAKVAGYVESVPFANNAPVKAGDIILKLDDGDYRLAVDAAKARIEAQQATIARIEKQAEAQRAEIDRAAAQVDMAQSQANNSSTALARQKQLASKQFASKQAYDDALTQASVSQSAVNQAKAGLAAAGAEADVLIAQAAEARAQLPALQTALAQAERDLSFTVIRAPFDGIVANRAVENGQYVEAGQRLMALVPGNATYVEANFKETQIGGLNPGQKAEVSVDAFDGQSVEGTVESISPASGAEFSLLPPENATGNFTKITQRVPVRIALPADVMAKLRPGLSVTVSINTLENGQPRVSSLQ